MTPATIRGLRHLAPHQISPAEMDWIWAVVASAAFLILAAYGINTLFLSKRLTLFPLLLPRPTAPHLSSERNAVPPESRVVFALLEEGGGEMLSVEKIMKRGPLRIRSQESVKMAATMMARHRVGSLLVEDDSGEVQGIVTETDIVRLLVACGLTATTTSVGLIMSVPVITIDHKQSLQEAAELMGRYRIRHLAVTERGRVIGVLSVRDLLRPIYMEQAP